MYLSLSSVTHRYGDTVVLDGIDLAVEKGAFVSLLGPSGCGKTTTLRIIAGFVEPVAGSVRLDGEELTGVPSHRRNIGVVFQSYALFPHLTAAGNVGFGLKMRNVGRAERDRRVAEALGLVGLGPYAERYPAQLSGGQQQRVALARAIVIHPGVLLLDEPLSNLDAGLRAEMRDEITRLRERVGLTTVFVTHDQSEALAMSDRVVVMDHGRIVESATPEDLSERPLTSFTARFLGGRTVLPGAVEDAAEGRVFQIAGGGPAIPLAGLPARDDATHIVLRASRLVVAPDAAARDGAIVLPAKVVESVFLGDLRQLTVEVGGRRITVHAPTGSDTLPPGSAAGLTAPPGAVSFVSDTAAIPSEAPADARPN